MHSSRVVSFLLVAVALIGLAGPDPALGGVAGAGTVQKYDPANLERTDRIEGSEASDEFGTVTAANFLATAPAASGGGRVYMLTRDGVASSSSAAELTSRELERFGESWADLGHPPGTSNGIVVGAPGLPRGAARGAAPPTVVTVDWNNSRLLRDVRAVSGDPGSLFGWRLLATDSQFPAASYNGSFVASAPLQTVGNKSEAGAVYKHDTVTGARVWTFAGKRAGELAGYALALISDQNDDDQADLLVGAPGSTTRTGARAVAASGRVYLVSGANGKLLQTLEAPADALLFGYSVLVGGTFSGFPGILVGAPATARGKKTDVGAVYYYPTLDAEPQRFRGKRRTQGFGVSIGVDESALYVGSFEGSKNAKRDRRGSVTILTPAGTIRRTLRGKSAGEYFGRTLAVDSLAITIGAPGAPPILNPFDGLPDW